MVMQTIQIRLTAGLVEEIKKLVSRGIYPNSSECVRDAVRRLITGSGGKIDIPEDIKELQKKVVKEVKEQLQKPTGTVDFYPEDLSIRNKIFNSLRKTVKKFGFKEVETPAFENIDLLTKKSGEEILDQIFYLRETIIKSFYMNYKSLIRFAF